jgi:hypothetical protein
MRALAPLLLLPLAQACSHHHHEDDVDPVPAFRESERNDAPAEANAFGLLYPGERFFIDGFVRDDGFDPFDGFAFTASEPLHVDFLLWHGSPTADLDVCLYDPLVDQTLACWATTERPERGGVDVFAGGLDFQLVVESFAGDSSYSLELVVYPLFAAPLARDGAGLRGTDAVAERAPAALDAYRKPRPEPELVLEQQLTFDVETGLLVVRTRQRKTPSAE